MTAAIDTFPFVQHVPGEIFEQVEGLFRKAEETRAGFLGLTKLHLQPTAGRPLHSTPPEVVVKLLQDIVNWQDKWSQNEELQVEQYFSIIRAAYNGEVEEVRSTLFRNREAINATTQGRRNALHAAATNGHLEIVKLLVQANLTINGPDRTGITPLRMAVAGNHVEVTRYLLEQQAEPNIEDHDGWTPLHSAALNNRADIIKCLKAFGADVTKQTRQGYTALFLASLNGNVDCVKELLEVGTDENAWYAEKYRYQLQLVDDAKFSPLHCAALKGHAEIVRILLREGVPAKQKTEGGMVPLTLAAAEGHLACVRELMSSTPENDVPDVLAMALTRGHSDVFNYIMVTRDDYTWTELQKAAWKGDIGLFLDLIENGQEVDQQTSENGCTSLMLAIWQEHLECAKVIIEEGKADIKKIDKEGRTALHLAIGLQNLELAGFLLEKGAPSDVFSNEGKTPLHDACINGNVEATKLLLSAGADINVKISKEDGRGHTPLQFAAFEGHLECVQLLVERGASLEVPEPERCSALLAAASRNQVDVINYLLTKNADVHVTGDKGDNLLFWAALYSNIELLKKCLDDEGIDLNATNSSGQTPLHVASGFGHTEAVKLLLDKNAEIDRKDAEECTPLQNAAECNHAEVVKYLLEHGADIQTKDLLGLSPLHRATSVGSIDSVKMLVEMGADIAAKAVDEVTPLHLAVAHITGDPDLDVLLELGIQFLHGPRAKRNNAKCVEYLLDKNADINAKDDVGYTPLIYAAAKSVYDCAKILISRGADIDVKTSRQSTALHIAARNGHSEIVRLILSQKVNQEEQSRARLEASNEDKWTPLQEAICCGQVDCVRLLCDYGADLEALSISGKTPLYRAVEVESVEIIKLLLEKGANINKGASHYGNRTPLHLAITNGLNDIVQILIKHGADLDARLTTNDYNALHTASENGQKECLKILVDFVLGKNSSEGDDEAAEDHRSLIDSRLKTGLTPLHCAILGGHLDCAQILCEVGADVEAQSISGKTPLQRATEKNQVDTMKYLLALRADVNKPNKIGVTALHIAASNGLTEPLATLLESNADVNLQSNHGSTPVLLAAQNGHKSCVEKLIENGADTTKRDNDGDSLLHATALGGNLKTLYYMIDVDGITELISSKNNAGHFPFHCAARKGHAECVNVLLALGVSQEDDEKSPLINSQDSQGRTALHLAVEGGFSSVIEALIEAGTDVNIKTNDGKTCLHFAAMLCCSPDETVQEADDSQKVSPGHVEYDPSSEKEKILLYLLDNGAKYAVFDENGNTPIHYTKTHRQWQLIVSRIPEDERQDVLAELALESERIRRTAQKVIGPEGGEIHLSQYGVHLTIPPGALDQKQNISVKLLDALPAPGIQEDEMMASFGVELQPDGLRFKDRVQIRLPHCAILDGVTDAKVVLYHYRGDELTKHEVIAENFDEIPACTVRENELELYIDDFCSWFSCFGSWRAKRMNCYSFSRKDSDFLYMHIYWEMDVDGVQKDLENTEQIKGAKKVGGPGTLIVKRNNGDVHFAVMSGSEELKNKNIAEAVIKSTMQVYEEIAMKEIDQSKVLRVKIFQGNVTDFVCDRRELGFETPSTDNAGKIQKQGSDKEKQEDADSGGISEKDLLQLARDIGIHTNLVTLAFALGFTFAEWKVYKASNTNRDGQACTDGTLQMLMDWKTKTVKNKQVENLKYALENAEFAELIEKYCKKEENKEEDGKEEKKEEERKREEGKEEEGKEEEKGADGKEE